MRSLRVLNVFKKYYIGWHIKHNTKDYSKYHGLFDCDYLSKEIKEIDNIQEILSYFDKTIYLDLWVDICDKEEKFFAERVSKYTDIIIANISGEMFYLGKNNVSEFINSNLGDFENKIDLETNKIIGKTISNIKISKNLLLMAKKLDISLYNNLIFSINKKLCDLDVSKPHLSYLWNCINITSQGISLKIDLNDINKYILKNKDCIDKDEIMNFYQYLKMANIKNINLMAEILENI